jgi:hypothetical protein
MDTHSPFTRESLGSGLINFIHSVTQGRQRYNENKREHSAPMVRLFEAEDLPALCNLFTGTANFCICYFKTLNRRLCYALRAFQSSYQKFDWCRMNKIDES